MASGVDCGLGVGAPVKGRAIHDQDAGGWQHWNKRACQPKVEDVRVDVALGQPNADERSKEQRANHIDPTACVPVVQANAALPLWRIAMRAGHAMGEPRLVNVNNGAAICLISFGSLAEGALCVDVRFRVPHGFFYMSHPACEGPARLPSV